MRLNLQRLDLLRSSLPRAASIILLAAAMGTLVSTAQAQQPAPAGGSLTLMGGLDLPQNNGFGTGPMFRSIFDVAGAKLGFEGKFSFYRATKHYTEGRSPESNQQSILLLPYWRVTQHFAIGGGAQISHASFDGIQKSGFAPTVGAHYDILHGQTQVRIYGQANKDIAGNENLPFRIEFGATTQYWVTRNMAVSFGVEDSWERFKQPFVAGQPMGSANSLRALFGIAFSLDGFIRH